MKLNRRTLITVITESALERQLIDDLSKLGVQGWTISDVRGQGSKGARSGDWDQSGNIRLEVICEEQKAKEILRHLKEAYYDNFAMIAFLADVSVLREGKF